MMALAMFMMILKVVMIGLLLINSYNNISPKLDVIIELLRKRK